MEVTDHELIFERAFDIEGLSSFNCGVRELDLLIHKKSGGLLDFIMNSDCEMYIVSNKGLPVAVYVYSQGVFETEDGNYDATEIDFIAVRKQFRKQGIGKKILDIISINSSRNNRFFLTVGAFVNKRYSAAGFYEKCGFELAGERQGNIIPMFKEL